MTQPVCLSIGAHAGIGGHVTKRVAREGFHAGLASRRASQGVARLFGGVTAARHAVNGFMGSAFADKGIEVLVEDVESNMGLLDVVVYKLGAQVGGRTLADTSLKALGVGWWLATLGLPCVLRAHADVAWRNHAGPSL